MPCSQTLEGRVVVSGFWVKPRGGWKVTKCLTGPCEVRRGGLSDPLGGVGSAGYPAGWTSPRWRWPSGPRGKLFPVLPSTNPGLAETFHPSRRGARVDSSSGVHCCTSGSLSSVGAVVSGFPAQLEKTFPVGSGHPGNAPAEAGHSFVGVTAEVRGALGREEVAGSSPRATVGMGLSGVVSARTGTTTVLCPPSGAPVAPLDCPKDGSSPALGEASGGQTSPRGPDSTLVTAGDGGEVASLASSSLKSKRSVMSSSKWTPGALVAGGPGWAVLG